MKGRTKYEVLMAKKKDVAAAGVQVRWVKEFGERIVDGYVWNAENEFVTTVAEADVERLVANGDFEVVVESDGAE